MKRQPHFAIFLATSGHSGVDRVMKNLLDEFASRGFEIDLLSVRNHGPDWGEQPGNVRKIDLGGNHVATCLPALAFYLLRNSPAALLSDKDKVNRTALLAKLLTFSSTKLIFRIGTTVSVNLARRSQLSRVVQKSSFKYLYPFAHRVITPSLGARDDLLQTGRLQPDKIETIASPIVTRELTRLAKATANHPWLDGDGCPLILGVGELSARKNFAMLIRAFALLRKRRRCRLLILGEGRQRKKLETLSRQLCVENDVQLPGFCSNPYPFMKRADLFVLTSNCEGSPVVLIEALAIGTPVISTDCPSGPRETLQEGRFGVLVKIDDYEALAVEMEKALDKEPNPKLSTIASQPFQAATSADRYLQAMGLQPTPENC